MLNTGLFGAIIYLQTEDSAEYMNPMGPDKLIRYDNPLWLAILFFILIMGLTYIFYKFIILPMQKKHTEKEENLKNIIKINRLNQEMREQKIRSALFLETVENERKRMAKELHDGLGTVLSSVKLKLETHLLSGKGDSDFIDDSIRLLIDGGKELRNIIHELRPIELEKHGLSRALDHLIEDFAETNHIEVETEELNPDCNGDEILEVSVYRIVQEILTNISRHSGATHVNMKISADGESLFIYVKDNGAGFDAGSLNNSGEKGGYGMSNIIERVSQKGGTFKLNTYRGDGAEIIIVIPLEKSVIEL